MSIFNQKPFRVRGWSSAVAKDVVAGVFFWAMIFLLLWGWHLPCTAMRTEVRILLRFLHAEKDGAGQGARDAGCMISAAQSEGRIRFFSWRRYCGKPGVGVYAVAVRCQAGWFVRFRPVWAYQGLPGVCRGG